jgi:ATP-dependent DNA ligase
MNLAYRPMLAMLVDEPFDDKEWVFETKWDGFRLITEKRDQSVRLWSRNGIDVTTRYAVLPPALQKIKGSCVIDGELCALDARGFVQVCAHEGATYLPFEPVTIVSTPRGNSTEVVYEIEN